MSYILEALRKSERERQTGQVPSLPALVADPPRRQSWFAWLVAALLLFNAVGLAYFWLNQRERGKHPVAAQSAGSAPARPPAARMEEPDSSAAARDVAAPSAVIHEDSPPQAGPPPAPKPPARTARRSETKPAGAANPPSAARPKPASRPGSPGKQPAAANAVRSEEAGEIPDRRPAPELTVPARETPAGAARPPAVLSSRPDGAGEADKPGTAERGEDEIPLLRAMPVGFRERVPPFNINIYAYSKLPAERFAIIDMKKYLVGDRIPGGALLLEIRSDSLVLELDGTKFRVPRP
jgi:general secretion pathway protein B